MSPQEQLRNYHFCQVLCKRAMEHIETSINDYLEELALNGEKSTVQSIEKRIKTFDSAKEKCRKRNIEMAVDPMLTDLRDIAGIRIITLYLDDVYRVADAIEARLRINIPKDGIKDYIKNPKDNGYRSLHLIAKKELFFNGRTYIVPVEIQIRTYAMHLWATLEHGLVYKREDDPSEVREEDYSEEIKERFSNMATYLSEVDAEANKLHREAVAKP